MGMLSVLIETENDEEGLARTLASLVSGAVDGTVRRVVVCDRGSTDATAAVAEQAGCHFIAGGDIAAGLATIADDWLLLLEPGAVLGDGWTESVATHAAKLKMAARFSRAKASRAPFLSRIFRHQTALSQGLLIQRKQAIVLAKKAATGEAIARGLAVRTLRAEIWPVRAK